MSPPAGTVDLWAGALDDVPAQPGVLDPAERARWERFVRPEHQRRYLAAHVALRHVLGDRLNLSPAAVPIAVTACPACGAPHGRPAVIGEPGVAFSLSYAGQRVLIAVARTPVGVDIEAPLVGGSAARAVAAHLSAGLQRSIDRLPPARQPGAVLRAWVQAEAYLKAIGTGIAGPGRGPETADFGLRSIPRSPPGWLFADLGEAHGVPPGYLGALAVSRPEPEAPEPSLTHHTLAQVFAPSRRPP